MNREETQYWVEGLLPGTPTVVQREFLTAEVLVGADGNEVEDSEAAVGAAVGAAAGADATEGSGSAGAGAAGSGAVQTVAITLDAAEVDAGLATEDGSDLRVEFLTIVAGRGETAGALVAAAAAMVSRDPAGLPPHPGTVLRGLGALVDEGMTARHGLLVPPYVWDEGVPHVHEVAGEGRRSVVRTTGVEFTHPGRLTLPVQIVMLTDTELEFLDSVGMDGLQRHLASAGVDTNNLWR